MLFAALMWVADKLPTLMSVAIVCVALYFAFIKRAMLVGGIPSTIKKLTRKALGAMLGEELVARQREAEEAAKVLEAFM